MRENKYTIVVKLTESKNKIKSIWDMVIVKKRNEIIGDKKKDAQMQKKFNIQIWYLNSIRKISDEKKEKKKRLIAFISFGHLFNLSNIFMLRWQMFHLYYILNQKWLEFNLFDIIFQDNWYLIPLIYLFQDD